MTDNQFFIIVIAALLTAHFLSGCASPAESLEAARPSPRPRPVYVQPHGPLPRGMVLRRFPNDNP
jgi:hypothetical protein